jgi:hypothetical protein
MAQYRLHVTKHPHGSPPSLKIDPNDQSTSKGTTQMLLINFYSLTHRYTHKLKG